MRIVVALCLVTVLPTLAVGRPLQNAARVDGIAAMLAEHPGVPGALPSDRSAWARLAVLPEAAQIVAVAESMSRMPVPELPEDLYFEFYRTGNRTHYEKPYFERIRRLDALALAEALEWKNRFLPAIERYLRAILRERSWTLPAHDQNGDSFKTGVPRVRLFSSQRAWVVSTVVCWLGDRLPADLAALARAECRRRVIEPYLGLCRNRDKEMPEWWFFGVNNWNAVCHAGSVSTALALCEDRRERAECIEGAERGLPSFLGGFTDDGYCSEGMAYWEYGFGSYISLVLTVREATGGRVRLLSDTAKAGRIAEYVTGYQLEPGLSPWFADGCGNVEPSAVAMARAIWPDVLPKSADRFPVLAGKTVNYGWLQCTHNVALRAFVAFAPAERGLDDGVLPIRTVYPEAQVYILRAIPGRKGLSMALKGGHNAENHNHNDLGSYVISFDGVILTGDPGSPPYTRKTFSSRRYEYAVLSSLGHPVPRIGGILQSPGAKFRARVLSTSFAENRDEVRLDLKGAYDGKAFGKLERTFICDRKVGRVIVRDEIGLAEPMSVDVPVITLATAERRGTGWVFTKNGKKLSVSATAQGGTWHWDEQVLDNERMNEPRRIALAFDKPVASATVEVTFTEKED